MRKLSLYFWLFLVLAPSLGWGGNFRYSSRGTTAAGFLKLGVGARAVAMGDAYSAVADDANAVYWNPAALTRTEKRSAAFMHAAYIDSSYFDALAYAQNFGRYGAFGGGLQYLSAGKITETDDATGADVGHFTPYDFAFSAGYAYQINGSDSQLDGFSLGLVGKFIQSKIIGTAETGAVDLGVLSPAYFKDRLRLALTVSNLGVPMRFDHDLQDLPLALRLGSAYKLGERWLAALDVGFPNDNNPYAALGTEYVLPIRNDLSLTGRLGFNSRTIGSVSGFTGFSFGLGAAYQKLSLDYGFLPFGSMGNVHRVSLSAKF